jgi:hypothetical protein
VSEHQRTAFKKAGGARRDHLRLVATVQRARIALVDVAADFPRDGMRSARLGS